VPSKSARVHVITGQPSWGDRALAPGNAWGPADDVLENASANPARLLVVAEPPLAGA